MVYFAYKNLLSFMVVFGVCEYQQNTRQIIHGNNKSQDNIKMQKWKKENLNRQ